MVSEDHDIVHLSDRAGRYLQFASGELSQNLLKNVRPELRLELRTALYQAARNRTSVEARGLSLRIGDRQAVVDIVVRPVLREDDPARGFFLVLFDESADDAARGETEPSAPVSTTEPARQLEEELLRLKTQLRTTVEHHETQAEELKASNEELQAINEELRSATEELETSKEELQSVNEELRTVNQELKIKIEEQSQANNDTLNLINSTDVGTLFLDRGSRIKLFTPRARDIFTLIPTDRGRPLSDINSHLKDADLQADIDRVLERLERVEREVETKDGRWQLMRIALYRTSDERIDGVVLTFVDITKPPLVGRAAAGGRPAQERVPGDAGARAEEPAGAAALGARDPRAAEGQPGGRRAGARDHAAAVAAAGPPGGRPPRHLADHARQGEPAQGAGDACRVPSDGGRRSAALSRRRAPRAHDFDASRPGIPRRRSGQAGTGVLQPAEQRHQVHQAPGRDRADRRP